MKKAFSSYTCGLCKFEYPFENVKYTDNGKRIVCIDCYNRVTKTNKAARADVQTKKKKEIEQPTNTIQKLIDVICVNCRYKFSLKIPSTVKAMCPYCGKAKFMREEDISADGLLKEVSQNSGFY